MSVCPHGITRLPLDGLGWNLIFELLSKIRPEISSSIKSDKNNGYFTWNISTFITVSRRILLRMRKVSNTSCIENKYTFYVPWLFSKNRAVYEIMSKNLVEPERPQITIWRRLACWISKATRVRAHASTLRYAILPLLFKLQRCNETRHKCNNYSNCSLTGVSTV